MDIIVIEFGRITKWLRRDRNTPEGATNECNLQIVYGPDDGEPRKDGNHKTKENTQKEGGTFFPRLFQLSLNTKIRKRNVVD